MNVLHMLAFITRSRESLEQHGLGEVSRADSQRLLTVFAECERHLLTITDRMTSDTQQQVLVRSPLSRWLQNGAWRRFAANAGLLLAIAASCFWGGYYLAQRVDVRTAAEAPAKPEVRPAVVTRRW
jgi:hypothetical protein